MNFSIVIPAYNESSRLPKTLEKITEWIPSSGLNINEVIIVDDGSKDNTLNIISKFSSKFPYIRLIKNNHEGGMSSRIRGIKNSKYEYIINLEADLPVPLSEIKRLINLKLSFDILFGSRIIRNGLPKIEGKPFIRNLFSFSFIFFKSILFVPPYKDTQIGFSIGKRDKLVNIIDSLELKHDGLKATEMIFKGYAFGYEIIEEPVLYFHDNESKCVPNYFPIILLFNILFNLFNLWLLFIKNKNKYPYKRRVSRFF